jgi:thioredoxin 1
VKGVRAKLGSANILDFSDADFDEQVLKADTPVVVDFWAEWCVPCKFIVPVLEEVSQEYSGKVKVGKLDVDANQSTAARYMIRSIPTVLFFKDGKVVDQAVGAKPKAEIVAKLEALLEG